MKKICIFANGYPTTDDPSYAFIQPIAHAFADAGCQCTVIAAQSVTNCFKNKVRMRPKHWSDTTSNGSTVHIFQPRFLSFSNLKIGNTKLSSKWRDYCVKRCYRKEHIEADIMYAHFWECAVAPSQIIDKKNLPLFVVSGESKISVRNDYSERIVNQMKEKVTGLICVSTKNELESRKLGLVNKKVQTIVQPNGYDPKEFYNEDKKCSRSKLGLSPEAFIGIFVGEFCERKGSERVIEAAKAVPDLQLIMVGSGALYPTDQVIFHGLLPHNKIVSYLNAADFFILPTLAEGCCNAIVEALACGLPVISSDRDFNNDILDNTNSLRVDPMDIHAITKAISALRQDRELCNYLSSGSLKTAEKLTIKQRANNIISFITDCIIMNYGYTDYENIFF